MGEIVYVLLIFGCVLVNIVICESKKGSCVLLIVGEVLFYYSIVLGLVMLVFGGEVFLECVLLFFFEVKIWFMVIEMFELSVWVVVM